MKRYRVFGLDFDSRALILSLGIQDTWDGATKQQHQESKRKTEEGLFAEFGTLEANQKRQNFVELGPAPFSILAFHNKFLQQVRTAFVMGAYYPALTASCALGERILNHLILSLRDDYKGTPEYKRVYNKRSFDNWAEPIDVLEVWGVLLPKAASTFRSLWKVRNQSLHFNPDIDTNDRQLALEAIRLLNQVVSEQFAAFGSQPWFITDVPGEYYIKKEAETQPFVRKVYLPNCILVSPAHSLEFKSDQWIIHDVREDNVKDLTDDEFVELRRQHKSA